MSKYGDEMLGLIVGFAVVLSFLALLFPVIYVQVHGWKATWEALVDLKSSFVQGFWPVKRHSHAHRVETLPDDEPSPEEIEESDRLYSYGYDDGSHQLMSESAR